MVHRLCTTQVQAIYDQVMTAFDIAIESYALHQKTHLMQEAVQDYFEQGGIPPCGAIRTPKRAIPTVWGMAWG